MHRPRESGQVVAERPQEDGSYWFPNPKPHRHRVAVFEGDELAYLQQLRSDDCSWDASAWRLEHDGAYAYQPLVQNSAGCRPLRVAHLGPNLERRYFGFFYGFYDGVTACSDFDEPMKMDRQHLSNLGGQQISHARRYHQMPFQA